MEFLAIGDLHIGCLDNVFQDLEDPDSLIIDESLAQPFNYAKANGIEKVILLGDLFDNPYPTDKAKSHLLRKLGRDFREFEIHAIPGNHDHASNMETSFEVPMMVKDLGALSNVYFYTKPEATKLSKFPFAFLPWPHVKNPKPQDDPTTIIAHITAAGAKADNGRIIDAKHGAKIDATHDRWIIGDLHTRQSPHKNVHYPGTLHQVTFGESFPKGFFHCYLSSKGLKIKFHPVDPVYKLIGLRVETLADLKRISKNPRHRYKLALAPDIVLPSTFLRDNPNIIDWSGASTRIKVNDEHVIDDSDTDTVIGPLDSYLKAQGVKQGERKKAIAVARSIRSAIDARRILQISKWIDV